MKEGEGMGEHLNSEESELTDQEKKFAEMLEQFSLEYEAMCHQRHEDGALKYGPAKFLTTNTFEEMLFEIADLGNYARYTFIKVRLAMETLAGNLDTEVAKLAGTDVIEEDPSSGFVKSKDATKLKES